MGGLTSLLRRGETGLVDACADQRVRAASLEAKHSRTTTSRGSAWRERRGLGKGPHLLTVSYTHELSSSMSCRMDSG